MQAGDAHDRCLRRFEASLRITRWLGCSSISPSRLRLFRPACQRCLGEARLDLESQGQEYQDAPPNVPRDDTTTPYLTGECRLLGPGRAAAR